VRQGDEDVDEHHVHLAAEQSREPGAGALVRHVGDAHAGHRLEQLHGEVWRGAAAGGGVVELVGRRAGGGDELRDRIEAGPGVHRQHAVVGRDDGDGNERIGIEAERRVQALVDDDRAGRGEEQRVAVRRGPGDELGAEVAACARAVLHDHGLAPLRMQLLGRQARERVAAAAGLEGDDDANRFGGVVPGQGRKREEQGEDKRGESHWIYRFCNFNWQESLSLIRSAEIKV